ncbi:hypothetical protein FFLO_06332 [Filobasidium floriforme]|uniref:Uncharacterized protein n=1 Tax=Filobasidium floriforme TaxID=5210 RepID=A0A8K0JF36_9TREE|nr:uncharacterized protein HD553DRAFT_272597 [Filobasidium floriforme]KAG7528217.1 hypothetical protein FFLO_06332 [Filobasidium floriforme]KAH8084278.1 hypothetical protein HD553DRAFT_272597 [Filobasidium floriforme]
MRFSTGLPTYLLFLLLVSVTSFNLVAASDGSEAMKKLCSSLSRATSCKASFKIPTFKVRTGKTDWFKFNPCKTTFRFPFGGKQCLPGTDKVVITVPIGIDMLSIVDGDTFKSLVQSGDAGTTSADILEKFGGFAQCAVDAGMSIKDNSAGLSQGSGALVTSSSVRVLRAAEIDLARYFAFAGSIVPCAASGACDAIRGFFVDYLQDSEKLMAEQIKDLLLPWSNGMNTVQKNFDALANSTDSLKMQGEQIEAEVMKIIGSFCPDAATCANNTMSDFKKQVETTLDMSKQIAALNGIIAQTQKGAHKATQTITDAVQLFEDVSDLGIDSVIQLIVEGKLNSIGQLAESLKAAQQLPRIIDTLQDNLIKVPELVGQVAQRGPPFVDSLQTLFTRNWIQDYAGDEASAEKISHGLFEAQRLLSGMIPQATQLWSSVEWLSNSVGAVDDGGRVGVDVRVASYQRWTKGWFDMPCLTTGKVTFSVAGFSQSVKYPKFYRCKQTYMVPFPNHHIPFVRIRLPEDSNLGRLGQTNPEVKTTSISWGEQRLRPTAAAASSVSSTVTSSLASSSESTAVQTSSSTVEESPITTSSDSLPTTSVAEGEASTAPASPTTSETMTSLPSTIPAEALPTAESTSQLESPASPGPTEAPSQLRRQQPAEEEDPPTDPSNYSVPGDIQTSIAFDPAAEGLYTASEVALAAGTATFVPDPAPSGTPTATEVAPDPAETTLAVPQSFDPHADLPEKVGEEDIGDWEDVRTLAINDATPTLSDGIISATAISTSTSQTNVPSATPTGTTPESSGGSRSIRFEGIERIVYGAFVAAVVVQMV